eukprot:scaffold1708_cov51-Phaeocystis_antarctica.AAC.1
MKPGPSKEKEPGPSTEKELSPSTEKELGPSKEKELGPSKEKELGPSTEKPGGLQEVEPGAGAALADGTDVENLEDKVQVVITEDEVAGAEQARRPLLHPIGARGRSGGLQGLAGALASGWSRVSSAPAPPNVRATTAGGTSNRHGGGW